jgi:AcrR family transcriptional regulator
LVASAGKRAERKQAGRDFRKRAILEAAARVFADRGLEGASVRDIAAEAGYTPGAIYFYFSGKEEVYGEILARSLSRLVRDVKDSINRARTAEEAARAGPRAFFVFYRNRPEELDLSFYLVKGIRPRGLTADLNRQLNGRLITLLTPMAGAIRRYSGLDQDDANTEAVAAVTHMCGILLMRNSGRLATLGFDPEALADKYLAEMAARLAPD